MAHHSCGQDCTPMVSSKVLAHTFLVQNRELARTMLLQYPWMQYCKSPIEPGDDSAFVRQDIAEQVCCNDNVELQQDLSTVASLVLST